jgi:hypothetical protein
MSLCPSGLINPTVNCWLNALVQAIISCPAFCDKVLETKTRDNKLLMEFYKLIYAGRRGLPMEGASGQIIQVIKQIQQQTLFIAEVSSKQQCVDEFYTMLIEALNVPEITALFAIKMLYEFKCPKCGNILKSYDMQLRRYIFDPPTEEKEFIKRVIGEQVEIDFIKCSQCNSSHSDQHRCERVVFMPKIYCVIFDKFTSRKMVHVLPHFKLFDKTENRVVTYKLVSQIDHFGSTDYGHYICRGLRKSDSSNEAVERWYTLDDNYITLLKNTDTDSGPLLPVSDTTFMLFYVRD